MRGNASHAARDHGDEIFERLLRLGKDLIGRYGRPVAVCVAVVAIALLVHRIYTIKRSSEERSSWQELSAIPGITLPMSLAGEDGIAQVKQLAKRCQQILDSHWETSATPWAFLKLGNLQYSAGLLADATTTYQRLIGDHPGHVAAETARSCLAALLEDRGLYNESAELCLHLAEQTSQNAAFFLHAGRNYELAGNREKARESYLLLLGKQAEDAADSREVAEWRLGRLEKGELFSLPPPPHLEAVPIPGTESEIPDEQAPSDDEKKDVEPEISP